MTLSAIALVTASTFSLGAPAHAGGGDGNHLGHVVEHLLGTEPSPSPKPTPRPEPTAEPTPTAEPAPAAGHKHKHKHKVSRGEKALKWARSRAGDPYVYGAAGPSSFDCSGLTMWVYHHLKANLPHSSASQASDTRRISSKDLRRGDLVFFYDGYGHVYHVAIWAGHGNIWHAPQPGQSVRKEHLWTRQVFYGRVHEHHRPVIHAEKVPQHHTAEAEPAPS